MAAYGRLGHSQTVLISGAGIAGLTLAFWLERAGYRPVVIEQAPELRAEGHGIDFAGTGWDVAGRMQLIPELCRRQNVVTSFLFKDRGGRTLARLPVDTFRRAFQGKFVNIMRQDLEAALYQVICDRVALRFGTSIRQLQQAAEQVVVTFDDGTQASFDLVVGADGIHSNVRRLVFGPERQFAEYLGYYAAAFPVPNLDHFEEGYVTYLEPDRQAGAYPSGQDSYSSLLVFRTPDAGYIPPARRKETLQAHYQGAGWVVPAMLESITASTPVYMDSLTQIKMPRWSEGRVVLIGDAAHCLTLLSGQGASTAMGGAYILAEELARTADHQAAFAAYERRVRPFVADKQRKARRFARTFVPRSALGLQVSYAVMKLLFTPLLARFAGKQFGVDSLLEGAIPEGVRG